MANPIVNILLVDDDSVDVMNVQRAFKKNKTGWAFFQAQPAGYRQLATHYVVSAKRPETRAKRLATLIEHSARRERVP